MGSAGALQLYCLMFKTPVYLDMLRSTPSMSTCKLFQVKAVDVAVDPLFAAADEEAFVNESVPQ